MAERYPNSSHEFYPLSDGVLVDLLSEDERAALEICLYDDTVACAEEDWMESPSGGSSIRDKVLQVLGGGRPLGDIRESVLHEIIIGIDDGKFDAGQCGVKIMRERRGANRLTFANSSESNVRRAFNNRFSRMAPGETAFLSAGGNSVNWNDDDGRKILSASNLTIKAEVWEARDPLSGKVYLAEFEPDTLDQGSRVVKGSLLQIVKPDGTETMDLNSATAAGINAYALVKQPGSLRYLRVVKGEEADNGRTGREWLNSQKLRFDRGSGSLHFAGCGYASGQEITYKDINKISDGRYRWGCQGCDCRIRSANPFQYPLVK